MNLNGFFDAGDIDLLSEQVRIGSNDSRFDLDSDGIVSESDRDLWIHDLKKTWFGDIDLDGEFNSADLVDILQAGEYEDNRVGNSDWGTGDWNGDSEFNTSDLVLALQDGGYKQGLRDAIANVPEPSSCLVIISGLLLMARRRL